ncbi:hypothetical protein PINS_up017309 [Pythium insidiosum]|nr:hypothetical protein PINS_up017309 [Pythium insidiosum]
MYCDAVQVCADRIYTIAGNDREDMVRWATVLTLVLRGEYKPKLMQRPESTIIRGSSAIPRASRKTGAQLQFTPSSRFTDAAGIRMTGALPDDPDGKARDDDVERENHHCHVRPAGITWSSAPRAPSMVKSWYVDFRRRQTGAVDSPSRPESSEQETCLCRLTTTTSPTSTLTKLSRSSNRRAVHSPLRFSRVENNPTIVAQPNPSANQTGTAASGVDGNRVAEGWILAKEPAAHRYRIRMLQLSGTKLRLFKPSMQGGRADEPCLTILMDEVTDIRPINDTREAVSAFTQCYPKQWGITLEGTRSIFTFYTRNQDEMRQWIDLLKNCPLFSSRATRLSIPVHPVATVEVNEVLEPNVVLHDRVGKLGDLIPTFAVHHFVLLEDGKLMYFVDESDGEIGSQDSGATINSLLGRPCAADRYYSL